MNKILALGKNTFRGAMRDRILYGILAFAGLFLASTVFLGSISLGEDLKIIRDFGLAGIYLFSIIITSFVGVTSVYKEFEQGTLRVILARPVKVREFILGKFLGLLAAVSLNLILMSAIYLVIVYVKGGGFDFTALWSILLLLFELAIFVSLTILFSTITSPLAGTIYALLILVIGHSLQLVKQFGENSSLIGRSAASAVYYLLPNLEKFNLRNEVVHNFSPAPHTIILPIIYSILYSFILLSLAHYALKKREL